MLGTRYLFVIFAVLLGFSGGSAAEPAPYYTGRASMEAVVEEIGHDLYQNITCTLNKCVPLACCNFVEGGDLDKTSRFGRILGEGLGDYLSRKGYKVIETQLRRDSIQIIENQGKFGLSRDLDLVRESFAIQAVIAGTYERLGENQVFISARLVSTRDSAILSSCSRQLGVGQDVLGLFEEEAEEPGDEAPAQPEPADETSIVESDIRRLRLDSPEDIELIQKRLSRLGLYTYKIDGIWGKRSKKALECFKKAHNMTDAHKWDKRTQEKLFEISGRIPDQASD